MDILGITDLILSLHYSTEVCHSNFCLFFFSPHFVLVSWGSSPLSLEDDSIDWEILHIFCFSSSFMIYLGYFLETMCLHLKIFDLQSTFMLVYLINFFN